jgi:RES domain-containing protein
MRLWRLSSARRAADFDGGYGIFNDGRWNTRGRPVTYCATVPSLAALEKRVQVADPTLLPPQVMVVYDVPDGVSARPIEIGDLPADWVMQQTRTQSIGDHWLAAAEDVLLLVPSVIVPIANAPDRNVLINHRAANVSAVRIEAILPFNLDPRLFRP